MSDQLNDVFPEPVNINVEGLEINIKPLTIGQFPKIAKLLKGIKFQDAKVDSMEFWIDLIADHGDNIFEMVAVASGQKKELITCLQFQNFVKVAIHVIKVNADFFTRQVMPEMTKIMTGLTSANASLPTATGTEISKGTH